MAIGFNYGGYVDGKITFDYDTTNTTTTITSGMPGPQVSFVPRNGMFALACIVLGLDTQELRNSFKPYFDAVQASWSDQFTYDYLIEKAYEVKYGKRDD